MQFAVVVTKFNLLVFLAYFTKVLRRINLIHCEFFIADMTRAERMALSAGSWVGGKLHLLMIQDTCKASWTPRDKYIESLPEPYENRITLQ